MLPLLQITLFGTPTISTIDSNGLSCPITVSRRPCGLLAYLALARGRMLSRNELTSALWGEHTESLKDGTLNTTLWRLRKAIERPPIEAGDLIVCDRTGAVGIMHGEHLKLDAEDFCHLIAPVLEKPLGQMTETDANSLRRGITLYSADLVAGFWDDWALREREKHRRYQLNALGRLMQISSLAKDAAAGIQFAQTILDFDSLREDVHRDLMRFYLMAGQRALALRQFEICRAALKRELFIQPMPETMALYRRIADNAVGVAFETAPELPVLTEVPEIDLERVSIAPRDLTITKRISIARHYLAAADAQLQLAQPSLAGPLSI